VISSGEIPLIRDIEGARVRPEGAHVANCTVGVRVEALQLIDYRVATDSPSVTVLAAAPSLPESGETPSPL
jgi:hypothetical protein